MFPAVIHISLADPAIGEFLFALMENEAKRYSTAPLWPDLHTLTLIRRVGTYLDVDLELLYMAVSSRVVSNQPISRLQLPRSMMDGCEQNDLYRLRQLVDVEEVTLYPEIDHQNYIVHWPDDHE